MPRSACLIFNPVAGQTDAEQDLQLILDILSPEFDLDVYYTEEDMGADLLAQKAVSRGAKFIIASGGDGTLSAAATALVGTGIPFGIISRGTANAFAAALGIPDTIEAACETILTGKPRIVDAAVCNGKPMMLLAGVGLEAETVEEADREAKDRLGALAYVISGLRQLRQLEEFNATIETEDKVIEVSALAITVANAAPATSILAQGPAELKEDDGLLDLTIFAPGNLRKAIAAGYHLLRSALTGNAVERQDIGYISARRFKITTDPPQKVVLDGEVMGTTPIDVECIPDGLTIIVPDSKQDEQMETLENLSDLKLKPNPR